MHTRTHTHKLMHTSYTHAHHSCIHSFIHLHNMHTLMQHTHFCIFMCSSTSLLWNQLFENRTLIYLVTAVFLDSRHSLVEGEPSIHAGSNQDPSEFLSHSHWVFERLIYDCHLFPHFWPDENRNKLKMTWPSIFMSFWYLRICGASILEKASRWVIISTGKKHCFPKIYYNVCHY
jgi:hypothetical protein